MKVEKRTRAWSITPPAKSNSLTIALFSLFVLCLAAQSVVGWRQQNDMLAAHGQALIGYWHNLVSSSFLEGLASNWQAAFLQLATLIVFSSIFYQRGAPHSRDPDKGNDQRKRREEATRFSWLYRHSLSVVFVLLFGLSLALHAWFGANTYNAQRALAGQSPISLGAFLVSAQFWSSNLQTWQAEYLTIALFVVLSVFLRQQDSAESKPLESTDESTGESNH
ncbi:MAG: hypothetical protein EPN74_02790 [Rhodanobacter sp.]|nr:MAG: hypothetical protein EPN74_02790 [Rhodanobacter sp.]